MILIKLFCNYVIALNVNYRLKFELIEFAYLTERSLFQCGLTKSASESYYALAASKNHSRVFIYHTFSGHDLLNIAYLIF